MEHIQCQQVKFNGRKTIFLIFATLIFIFNLSLTRADTNMTVDIWSTGDVLFNTNINTNGSVKINIDGTDVNNRFASLNDQFSSYVSWFNLKWIFSQVREYFYNTTEHISPDAINVFNNLNSVFLNRQDASLMSAREFNLNLRVTALEKTMETIASKEYCQGKIDTMNELNLTSVRCENSTWYNLPNGLISITPTE